MTALYEKGEVYLRAASEFTKEEYNKARKDNELCREFSGEARVEYGDHLIAERTCVKIPLNTSNNYYLYCLSKSLDDNLFESFNDADSCVILHDGKQFCQDCIRILASESSGLAAWANDVNYYDSHNIIRNNVLRI